MLPTFYQTHLQKQLTSAQFILLTILLSLIQSEKQVRLERLARVFPALPNLVCKKVNNFYKNWL